MRIESNYIYMSNICQTLCVWVCLKMWYPPKRPSHIRKMINRWVSGIPNFFKQIHTLYSMYSM